MRWRELLDTYADAMDRIIGPLTEDPLPSPERTKPETPQVWEVFKTDALVRPEPEDVPLPRFSLADLPAARTRRIDQGIADALADATETITNPYAQENPMTAPAFEPYDELDQDAHDYLTKHIEAVVDQTAWQLVQRLNADRLDARRLANAVRGVANAEHPYTTEIMGVKIARCDSRGRTNEERAEYQRGLREGRLDNTVVRAEVVGSSEWLRDLADRLQQYLADRVGDLNPEHAAETPHSIRERADEVERDEQARAASAEVDRYITDTAGEIADKVWDTFRIIGLGLPEDGAPTWLADGIESALRTCWDQAQADRAGRDDQEANRG